MNPPRPNRKTRLTIQVVIPLGFGLCAFSCRQRVEPILTRPLLHHQTINQEEAIQAALICSLSAELTGTRPFDSSVVVPLSQGETSTGFALDRLEFEIVPHSERTVVSGSVQAKIGIRTQKSEASKVAQIVTLELRARAMEQTLLRASTEAPWQPNAKHWIATTQINLAESPLANELGARYGDARVDKGKSVIFTCSYP